MHAVRSARPKLSLAVPAITSATAATKPMVPTLNIPSTSSSGLSRPSALPAASPLTPTARNTALNATRTGSSLHVPSTGRPPMSKKPGKKVSFAEQQIVTLVSPCPQDYYGDYAKMSRDERRWTRR